jgi:hypothetical protein
MLQIEEVKAFLREDSDEPEVLQFIELCINSAEIYIKKAVDDYETKILNADFVEQAKIPMFLLIQQMYDKRTYTIKEEKVNFIMQSFMQQLAYGYEVEE